MRATPIKAGHSYKVRLWGRDYTIIAKNHMDAVGIAMTAANAGGEHAA